MKKSEMCWLNDMYKLFVEGLEIVYIDFVHLFCPMRTCLNNKYAKTWK